MRSVPVDVPENGANGRHHPRQAPAGFRAQGAGLPLLLSLRFANDRFRLRK